jgi:hypothetical protein
MEDKSDKKLTWVVFYGLSALGKTYFLKLFQELCKEKGVKCQIVSSDDCSKAVVDKLMAENKSLTQEQAFDKTRKESVKLFEDRIDEAVKGMSNGKNIIVLDKVMNGGKFLQNINKTFQPCCATKMVAIVPEHGTFLYSYHGVVPFSQGLIINVLHRILNREEHQTVSGTDAKKAFLALSFVKLYNGVKSLTEKKDEGKIDEFVEVNFATSFTPEKEQTVPPEFTQLLKKTLKELKPFQGDNQVCAEIAAYVMQESFATDFKEVLGFGDAEIQKKQINSIINMF